MALKVRWTQESEESFNKIIKYLEDNWTEKEILKFVRTVNRVIVYITENPFMFKASCKKNIRKGFITKHISLFYSINEADNLIELLSFWDNRQDPIQLNI